MRVETEKVNEFLRGNYKEIEEITQSLGYRDFSKIKELIGAFLISAAKVIPVYHNAETADRQKFLSAVTNAWEIADSINVFNKETLGSAYKSIIIFSREQFHQIRKVKSKSEIKDFHFWFEVFRNSLIFIGEDYRLLNRLTEAKECLLKLIGFVEIYFDDHATRQDFLLGHCYYYLSKLNRFEGNLKDSEKNLLETSRHYCRIASDSLKEDITEDFVKEIQLRTGVVEVSWAWLYFNKRNYLAAQHSAQTALLLLSPSSDELIKHHVKLVIAAIERITAADSGKLAEIVKKLESLRKFFKEQNHKRLQSRTEYELVLTLILLDSKLSEEILLNERTSNEPLENAKTIVMKTPAVQPTERWKSLLNNLRARVLRRTELRKSIVERDFNEALKYAVKAYESAVVSKSLFCRIEALICQGEIRFQEGVCQHQQTNLLNKQLEVDGKESRRNSYSQTISKLRVPKINLNIRKNTSAHYFELSHELFSQALELCLEAFVNDAYIEHLAMVRLYLARTAIRLEKPGEYEHHWQEYRRLGQIEHAWLIRLEVRVVNERWHYNSLRLKLNSINFEESEVMLKKFLIEQAYKTLQADSQKITDLAVAEKIGIRRQTLQNWRKQIKKAESAMNF